MSMDRVMGYRTVGNTAEQVVCTQRCLVFGIVPELTTTGTITLRDDAATGGANVKHIAAIGLLQSGKSFGGHGVLFERGCTIQLSVASDLTIIMFFPI